MTHSAPSAKLKGLCCVRKVKKPLRLLRGRHLQRQRRNSQV